MLLQGKTVRENHFCQAVDGNVGAYGRCHSDK